MAVELIFTREAERDIADAYALYSEYTGRKVTNYGVFHASRDPERWRIRLLYWAGCWHRSVEHGPPLPNGRGSDTRRYGAVSSTLAARRAIGDSLAVA